MTQPPLVSVIIPTYNRATTVGLSIDSALAQTYRPLEIIVVDDGSTDATHDTLLSYGDRIRPIRRENGGPSAARNTGAAAASGEIIAFLDSDDLWIPDKIERQVRLMQQGGGKVPCCICNAALMGDDGPRTTSFQVGGVLSSMDEGYWLNPAPLIATRFILFNQVVAIRRSAFESVGGFDEGMRLLEDHDLAFRLALLGPWAFLSAPLVEKHEDGTGIGVQAMGDPTRHALAWKSVLERFIRQDLSHQPRVARLVATAITDVEFEIRAVQLRHGSSPFHRLLGRIFLRGLRLKGSIRRRLPSWPQVEASELPSAGASANP